MDVEFLFFTLEIIEEKCCLFLLLKKIISSLYVILYNKCFTRLALMPVTTSNTRG